MADTENVQEVTDEGGPPQSEEQVTEAPKSKAADSQPAEQKVETPDVQEVEPPAASEDAPPASEDAPAAAEDAPAAAEDAPAATEDAPAATQDAPATPAAEVTSGDGDEPTVTREGTEETTAADEEGKEAPTEETTEGDGGEAGAEKGEAQEATEEGDTVAETGEEAAATPEEGEDKEGVTQDETTEEKGEEEQPTEEDQAAKEGEEQQQLESETFAEGERAESPVTVGEKLSREGTPQEQEPEEQTTQSPPVPSTPEPGLEDEQKLEGDEDEEEDDEEEEEEDETPQFDRELLIERYQQALADRQQLQEQNHKLQHRLAEYFRKKKSDEVRQDFDKNVTDQEQRYLKYMASLDELRQEEAEERETYQQQIELLSEKCQEKQELVESERDKFTEHKKHAALNAVNSRSGKTISSDEVEQYLANEIRKENEVAVVRLENIKLRNKLKKTESQLKSKEELAEGLHMIDFEQLKIENQTYNEKIEERNEELMKLRKKITMTVQVLTHLKEKLQFVQAENQVQKARLQEVEGTAGKKRDLLTRTKQARDALRIDNNKLRQNCGLLGNKSLLRDYEELKDGGEDLSGRLEYLKVLHAELTLNLNGVRKKLEEARANQQQ